jgi:probable tRNA-dihydrouridine synthase
MSRFFNGFDSNVFLAPMAGITDKPMRRLVSSMGPGTMVSEMVAINAISRKNPKSYRIADVRDEPYKVVVQLVGGNEGLFADSVRLAEELGAHSVDINMGCPVKKIVNNHSGSWLMKDMLQASKIIESAVKASSLKVSVKFRKGWDAGSVNAVDFARMCEDSGAAYITVHGRTRSDFYSGTADWDIIAAVKQAVKIPVIGNGDIDSPEAAKAIMAQTGCDGIMIGRGLQGNPWLISQILHGTPKPDISEIVAMILRHARMQIEMSGEYLGIRQMRKHVAWYTVGYPGSSKLRGMVNQVESYAALEELLKGYEAGGMGR